MTFNHKVDYMAVQGNYFPVPYFANVVSYLLGHLYILVSLH